MTGPIVVGPAADPWTVAIHASRDDWTPLGTGVLVDERRVLTCAHVVRGRTVEAGLFVAFAKVGSVAVRWRVTEIAGARDVPAQVADVVVLTLELPAPAGAEPPPLRDPSGADLVGDEWWAFGFPNGDVFGSAADGRIGAALAYGWARLDTGSRYLVEPGFSGAGLWSARYNAVVGLVGQARVADDRPGGNPGDGRALTLRQIVEWLPEHKLGALTCWTVGDSGESALSAWGWTLAGDLEAGRHWRPRARGVSIDSEQGYRFRGRTTALAEIVGWLDRAVPDRRALVVTGSPGVGKSAVLGRVVTTADAGILAALPATDDGVKATVGSVRCAVHAKGKTALEVAAEIAQAASVGLPGRSADLAPVLREALAARPGQDRRFNVVIDALDEANSPDEAREIVTAIVLPLVQTCAAVGVQVVLGSRRRDDGGDLLGVFADAAKLIDLDDRRYFADDDLRAYALATLQLTGDERPGNPYENGAVAEPVATRIADLADRNFLVAGLIARSHGLHDTRPVDVAEIAFEATVAAALRTYLRRLTPVGTVAASTVLAVLAFAEAPGLPPALWHAGIRAFGADVGADDLARFARSSAANFLVESTDAGSGRCYRLFHQALNDALRAERVEIRDAVDDERALTDVWLDHGRQVGWDRAPEYLLRSLPIHAAVADRMDTLLGEDDYLRHADLRRLIPLADRARTPHGRQRARMLYLTPHAISAEPDLRAAMFNVTTVLEQLEPYPPTAAGPFRGVWATAAPRSERSTLSGHAGTVTALCAVPLGGQRSLLASASDDRTVRLWDAGTGRAQYTLTGHTDRVTAVCAVPVGAGHQLLASASNDGTVRLWDPRTGGPRFTLTGHVGPVTAVCAVAVDGRHVLASGGDDRVVRLWDPVNGQALGVLTGHTDAVTALCAVTIPDGPDLLASGGSDRTVRLWDPATGQLQRTLTGHGGTVTAVCTIPVGREHWLASAGFHQTIRLWDPRTGRATQTITGGFGRIYGICAIPVDGGHLLASATYDERVLLWDPTTGQVRRTFTGHTSSVSAVCAVPAGAGDVLASGSEDQTVRLWDPTTRTSEPAAGPSGRVNAVCAISVDGGDDLVASAGTEGEVRLWDAATGAPQRTYGVGTLVNAACAIPSVDGRQLLAVGGNDQVIVLYDPVRGVSWRLRSPDGRVRALCAIPVDGGRHLLVSAGSGQTIHLWDPDDGRAVRVLAGHADRVQAVCAVPTEAGCLLASGGDDRTVRLWDSGTGDLLRTLTGHTAWVTAVCAVTTAHGQVVLASGGNDQTVRLWNPDTGELLRTLTSHTDRVRAVCAMPVDGRQLLASAGEDQTVRLWDPTDGALIHTIHTHHPATSCAEVAGQLVIGLSVGVLAVHL